MKGFRTLRGRLTALALLVATVAAVALTVAFNVVLGKSLDSDANGLLRSRAAAAATTVTSSGGLLSVRESPDDEAIDRGVWVYQGGRAILRPPGGREVQRAADELARQPGAFRDLKDRELRLYATPVRAAADGTRGTLVVALSLQPYERTTNLALIGSLALAAVLLAAVFAVTWTAIGRALAPVTGMTRSVADWGAHDLDKRFGLEPRPDELGELAATFDDLLDRVAASLRHEQRLSAELSHELRTPLARMTAEIELLERRERSPEERAAAYAALRRSADQMNGIVDMLMAAARADSGLDRGRSRVDDGIEQAAGVWRPALADSGLWLDVEPAGSLAAGVEADILERILGPLLDNARRFARSRVTVTAIREGGRVVVTVADDGPGVAPDDAPQLFEPGVSIGTNGHRGAGLGLSLARRLARAAGGDLALARAEPGAGAQFRIELPA